MWHFKFPSTGSESLRWSFFLIRPHLEGFCCQLLASSGVFEMIEVLARFGEYLVAVGGSVS